MTDFDHQRFIRRAIELAANTPSLPFGAVIVDRASGNIVAEGWNRSSQNPIWHGEINAINHWAAGQRPADQDRPQPALALYTTAEPCPMCQAAILWSGIQMVVYGTSIRFLQSHGWPQIDILAEEIIRRSPAAHCTLIAGVLADECNALFLAARRQTPRRRRIVRRTSSETALHRQKKRMRRNANRERGWPPARA